MHIKIITTAIYVVLFTLLVQPLVTFSCEQKAVPSGMNAPVGDLYTQVFGGHRGKTNDQEKGPYQPNEPTESSESHESHDEGVDETVVLENLMINFKASSIKRLPRNQKSHALDSLYSIWKPPQITS